MATVEIPDLLFKRLQALAVPLVDSTASVIERLVESYESRENNHRRTQDTTNGTASRNLDVQPDLAGWNPYSPPDLRHTRVLSAQFAGRIASGWNNLVHVAHIEAMSRLGSLGALRNSTKSNFVAGRPGSEDLKKGYRHVPEINISIQNVDAEHAWSHTLRLARHLNVGVWVEFEWMQKSDAAHPGRKGRLEWEPKRNGIQP